MKEKLFLVDSSVLVPMFEGNNTAKAVEVLDMMSSMKSKGIPFKAVTTLVSFLEALWKANSKAQIKNIQSVMEIIEVVATPETDYKNHDKVVDDIIKFANKEAGD